MHSFIFNFISWISHVPVATRIRVTSKDLTIHLDNFDGGSCCVCGLVQQDIALADYNPLFGS